MNQQQSRKVIFIILLALTALLWLFVYALPRLDVIAEAELRAETLRRERSSIVRSLQDFADSNYERPNPEPNTSAWMSRHALKGLDKNIEANAPYKNSQGVQIKLRAVTAKDITEILDSMRSVNLIIKTFKLSDPDGDGKWNLEFMAEVPS
ncbi:hypothetical protein IJT93_05520 [bacterium]|nr:hypothetical protein [bacterium]